MTNDYFLLTKTKKGKLALSWKHNWDDMIKHREMADQYGDETLKIYEVDESLSHATLQACSDFVEGNITFGELEAKIKAIKEKGTKHVKEK